MCDHCAKVTSQKGYAGQVTCRCDHGGTKEVQILREIPKEKVVEKPKDPEQDKGCCSKKARELAGGCCKSGCCGEAKRGSARDEQRSRKNLEK
ncbi:hypothetical protein PV327_007003 [Microctonus hyperodae]|uniref:Uncharacterized protein n=1 Tax=Microctonus hyperodae TaxID=165561 RepID=A0AA39F5M0_MICHY|nr:hypothetical protein PV327_007003 [Microctonus hyperodae]